MKGLANWKKEVRERLPKDKRHLADLIGTKATYNGRRYTVESIYEDYDFETNEKCFSVDLEHKGSHLYHIATRKVKFDASLAETI